MSVINVEVRNRIARGDRKQIVLSNSDYTVHFDLDAEWANYHTKTMVVAHDNSVQEVAFTGTDAQLPIFEETPDGCTDRFMAIGLYAGDIRSSTPAVFPVLSSAKGMAGTHVDPPEDVYTQLLALIEAGAVKGEPGKSAYEYAVEHGYTGTEEEFGKMLASLEHPDWNNISNKPFKRIGTTLKVVDDTVDVNIYETTNPEGGLTLVIGE